MNSSLASSSARLLRPSRSSSYAARSFATASSSSSSSSAPSPPRKKRPSRTLSSQPGADLVGPPDPVSNLRPVIYGSAFDAASEEAESSSARGQRRVQAQQAQRQASQHHPYSTSEFTTPATSASLATTTPSATTPKCPPSPYYLSLLSRLESAELTHHLLRSRADGFSQRFWADNNQRYAAALSAYRSLHPSKRGGAGGEGKDDDESVLLAPFYSAWLDANSKRYAAYNQRLWRMTRADLGPAVRYEGLKVWVRCVAWWEAKKPW